MADFNNLLSYAPYIEGTMFLDNKKTVPRVDVEQVVRFAEHVHSDSVAEQLFDACDKHTDFFSMHVDSRTWVPKELQAEIFYATKVGELSPIVPSMCVFLINKAWKECYGIPNLLFKVMPKKFAMQFFVEGYIAPGYTITDVVRTLCDEEYTPLSTYRKKIRHAEYSEVYVAESDMVAALPNRIADELNDGMIDIIHVTPNGLAIGESLIRTMGGSYGITDSVYDLRELV